MNYKCSAPASSLQPKSMEETRSSVGQDLNHNLQHGDDDRQLVPRHDHHGDYQYARDQDMAYNERSVRYHNTLHNYHYSFPILLKLLLILKQRKNIMYCSLCTVLFAIP